MKTKEVPSDINELRAKILKGMRKALRDLAETAAINDESLVIGDKEGNVKSVPAKELLRDLKY